MTILTGNVARLGRLAVALALAASMAWAGQTAPDAAGYTGTDSAVYSFIDLTVGGGGGSVLANTDDAVTLLTLPFSFGFYGKSYSLLCVSSNGLAYFVTAASACVESGDFQNVDLTAAGPPGNLPAAIPYWTDLTFNVPGGGAIYYQSQGAAPSRKFIVQWNRAYPQATVLSANPVTFEMLLYESSNQILFQYKTVNLGSANPAARGAQSTVGIRDASGNTGNRVTEWSYDAAVLNDGSALLFAPATPTIAWSKPAAIAYGTALSAAQLNATASVPGTFVYAPAAGTVLPAGNQTLSVTFTPTDAADYATATASVTITVNPGVATVTLGNLTQTYTGGALTPAATTSPSGLSIAWTGAPQTNPGSYPVTAAISNSNYQGSASGTFTIDKGTPVIAWSTPAAITYGAALTGAQLNATTSVPGTFVYTPALGTVLPAGSDTLSVTFTPTDATDYASTTMTESITVGKATPTVTWPAPSAITYGMALSNTQLNATATVAGTFVYTPPVGALLNAGIGQTLSVTFTPANQTDYSTATARVSITVLKATPVIAWSNPANIPYGAALGGAQLNATASVPGTYAYTPPAGTVLNPGSGQTLSVVFTPSDLGDYNTAAAAVSINVLSGCVYVLAPSSTSVTMSGNPSLTSSCGIYVDSNSSSAMVLSGSPAITVTGGGTTNIVGWYTASGSPAISPAPQKLLAAVPDPFAGLAEPAPNSNCQDSSGAVSLSGSTSKTLNPGTYCHAISMSGSSSLTLNPGLYILKGGIAMSGTAGITGNQVTLFTYSGSMSLSGTGGINITAPSSSSGSAYAGIAIFQSRSDSSAATLSGGSAQKITGAVYLPDATLTYSGGSSASVGSITALAVKEIVISGNSHI
jgi:surface antigen